MSVYLYAPPQWQNVTVIAGMALRTKIPTSTTVYRLGGVWHNVLSPGMDQPVISDVDVDPDTGLRLYFTKPMVVPGSLHDELAALQPADPSWTPGSLTLL